MASCAVRHTSSSPLAGNGAYSAGFVERSATVFEIEYVPLNATTMRLGNGGCEIAMYPQESERRGPVFQVVTNSKPWKSLHLPRQVKGS